MRQPVTLQQARPVPVPGGDESLPFGNEFQGMFLKILLENNETSRSLGPYVKANFFQNEAIGWAWSFAMEFKTQYSAYPSMALVMDRIRTLDSSLQPTYAAVLDQARSQHVTDEPWIKDQALDFIKRQIFRQAFIDSRDLFNAGNVTAAYDLFQERLDEVNRVQFDTPDRQWLMDEFADRHIERQHRAADGTFYTGTGLPDVDRILGGGAYPGFVGCFLARPKAGKTTLLTNIGATALRSYQRNVLHFTLEGSGTQIADRYDTIFTEELYGNLKRGEVDASKYSLAFREMQMLRQKCVLRGFTDKWEYDITHIWEEMREMKRLYGWDPDVIILDYVDLLNGRPRPGGYKNKTESAVEASQDVKALSNRGYAIWTASQVQRPKDKDFDDVQEILKSREIADAYGRVRIFDMIGSINQTREERRQGLLRGYIELYRDGEADHEFLIGADFSRMRLGGSVPMPDTLTPGGLNNPAPQSVGATHVTPAFGYGQLTGV